LSIGDSPSDKRLDAVALPAENVIDGKSSAIVGGNLPLTIPAVFSTTPRPPEQIAAPEAQPSGQSTVSEVFEETDVREAIRVLASMAGQSVVIDDTVGGFTSTTIENESFENALRKVTLPLGLVVGKYQGQYLVGTTDPASALFPFLSVTYRYEPQHRASKALLELLPERLQPYIRIAENWNIVVVDAPERIGQETIERLRDLDQPVPQVLLEAIICVVAPDSGFRFGFDWNHSLAKDASKSLDVGFKGLSFSGLATQSGIKNAFEDFAVTTAFVQALADQGYITIRATPRVFAKDGEKAEIIIGRETFFSLQPTNTSSLLFRPDIQKVTAGITLNIVPHIRGDNVSVLIERAEVSEDIRTNTAQFSSNPYPIINRRSVSTTVHVRDGQTIAIGGLVQRQTVDRNSKVPLLGDIPLVGKLFQTTESQEQDVEIAIFISPKIVQPYADSATTLIQINTDPRQAK
jgi:type II secretory pathway component GspD/PulD (secretin)